MSHEAEQVVPWLREALGWRNPVFAGPLSGGNSNLTWRFVDGEQACVVRTSPGQTISPTAHRGIEREYQVLRSIENRVKAPRVLGWHDGDEHLGRPFLVVEFIDGVSITDTLPKGYSSPVDAANQLGSDLMDSLASIHRVPIVESGLAAIGKPERFLHRQITRWLAVRSETGVRDLPTLFTLGNWLLENVPPDCEPCLVHGDYHLDNTLASPEKPEILAVIDWEMATVGDPYTDLALALMLWGDTRFAQPPAFAYLQAISRHAGVADRRSLAANWSQQTDRDLSNMDYYMAYAFWRLAAIVEGAFCLQTQGKVDSAYARGLEYNVPALLREAQEAAAGNW